MHRTACRANDIISEAPTDSSHACQVLTTQHAGQDTPQDTIQDQWLQGNCTVGVSEHNTQSIHTHAAHNELTPLPTKMTACIIYVKHRIIHALHETTTQAAQLNHIIITHVRYNVMQSHHICHTEQTQQHVIIISSTDTLTSTCNNPVCLHLIDISRIVRNNDLHATIASHVCVNR